MKRLKSVLGVVFICMAMGELATGFLAYPATVVYSMTRTEWWATYLPPLMLVNSLLASILLMFCGVKMTKESSFFTEKQSQWFEEKISRWAEKRKYGYHRSDDILNKESKVNE